jgi:hypothetical protein
MEEVKQRKREGEVGRVSYVVGRVGVRGERWKEGRKEEWQVN